jgi:putative flippase GtrA
MRLVKYFFVGGAAATIDISLFALLTNFLGFPWVPVSICTFLLATLFNYLLSIKFVFESGVRHKKHVEIVGVFAISGLSLLVNQSVLYIAIELFGWHLLLSKIIATGIVFFWNYFGRSKIIF